MLCTTYPALPQSVPQKNVNRLSSSAHGACVGGDHVPPLHGVSLKHVCPIIDKYINERYKCI